MNRILRADQRASPAGVAEFRKKQYTLAKHGYCAILAEFPALSAAVAGLVVNNRHRDSSRRLQLRVPERRDED